MAGPQPDLENFDALSVDTLELEKEFQEQWEADIKRLTDLSKRVRNLHVQCLYCRSPKTKISEPAYEAWKAIVKNIGSAHNHWRDLGFFLGIPQDDLNYIEFSVNKDKTDTVLRLYMENELATMDHVTEAFVKMKRYDILKALEEPLLKINQHFFKGNTSSSDAGYHSRGSDSEHTIVKPKNIINDLPAALRASYVPEAKEQKEKPAKPEPPTPEPPKPEPKRTGPVCKIDDDKPTLLLTFAEDGKEFAEKIRDRTASWSADSLLVQTLTLNERKNEVELNPPHVIMDFIEQANYIVPIITGGYLESISSITHAIPSSTENLDVQYARYIFTQLMNRYIVVDGCLNKKVRCVIPESVDRNITLKLNSYPVLLPWTCEVDFDETFKDLVKRVQKN